MELYSKELGHGSPIVILHGLYGSSDNWTSIGRELSKEYRVLLVDLRNHGRSPHNPSHTYQDMVSDLTELFNREGLEKPVIIGHSMGGKVAMHFASQNAVRVRGLVVADILPFSYSGVSDNLHVQEGQHAKILSSLLMLNTESASTREELDIALAHSIPSKAVRQFLLKNIKRNDSNRFQWQLNVAGLSQNLETILSAVLPIGGFERLSVPTLFLKGENSRYVYPEGEAQLASYFSDYSVVSIPNAGHWLHSENPKAFLEEVMAFMKSLKNNG